LIDANTLNNKPDPLVTVLDVTFSIRRANNFRRYGSKCHFVARYSSRLQSYERGDMDHCRFKNLRV